MLDSAVTTRCGREDAVHASLRAAISVPTWRYLWIPADGFEFIPELCDTIYGDGRALFKLTTLNSRPRFYVIRADSSWSDSNYCIDGPTFGEFVDDICWDLEDQFGPARLDSEEDDPDIIADGAYPWPALNDEGGTAWGRMDWPKIPGIETCFVPGLHYSLLARAYAVEDQFARWADDGGRLPAMAENSHPR
jgi:hypothetical protein